MQIPTPLPRRAALHLLEPLAQEQESSLQSVTASPPSLSPPPTILHPATSFHAPRKAARERPPSPGHAVFMPAFPWPVAVPANTSSLHPANTSSLHPCDMKDAISGQGLPPLLGRFYSHFLCALLLGSLQLSPCPGMARDITCREGVLRASISSFIRKD